MTDQNDQGVITCAIGATVACYSAIISYKLISSRLEVNDELDPNAVEAALAAHISRTSRPTRPGASQTSIARAWACLVIERALATFALVTTQDASSVEAWLRSVYDSYDNESLGASSKIFRLKATLAEDGGVAWQFTHPEQGEFAVPLAGFSWGATVDNYVASVARIDLLRRYESGA